MHFSPSFAFYFCFTFKFLLFFNPTLFLLYFLHFFFLFFLHFFHFFFLFFLYFFHFFLFLVQFFCFFPPFSTFFFCIHLYFLESRFTSLHFISAFLFSSIPAFQLHFIPALFICVSLLFSHIFSCFFFPLLLCLTAIPFQLLLSSSTFFLPLSSRPASTLSFRLHYSNTPTFTLHSHPSPPPAPHPAPNKACRGGTAAPPLSALQCGGRSPGGSSAPLRPPQQLSAAPPPDRPRGRGAAAGPPGLQIGGAGVASASVRGGDGGRAAARCFFQPLSCCCCRLEGFDF